MSSARAALRVVFPFALHGLAREVDGALGILLRTSLDLPWFVPEALALVEMGRAVARLLLWTAAGLAVWVALAAARARGGDLRGALAKEARGFSPLLLRPAITLLALAALAAQPTHPYGFTLPVALTQDWGTAQDAAALAALVAARAPVLRLPAPGAGSIGFLAFLACALLTPGWARVWDGHPGNEPKTLRMAVALGHWLTLDVEDVSGRMEDLEAAPAARLGAAAGALFRESGRMLAAFGEGPDAFGASAIRATRITRQTVRGKDGGVYHVLAPGPSALLAPALRLDRALNRLRGTPGRLTVSLLLWNALGAATAAALFLLLREASGRAGLAAALTAAVALLPPYVFYAWQFYPELPGALALAVALRTLLFRRWWSGRTALWLGLLLSALPWLHQKFLPVWVVLTLMAVAVAVDRLVAGRALVALLLPQAATLYLFALYNFSITGSVRPDALFLAWGPRGVTTERLGQGLLGLVLDARYGLLPYVPLYLMAGGGLILLTRAGHRLRLGLPAVAVYYVTVAAADNWAGAVCNLGRYVMPATPLLAASVAAGLAACAGRRGVAAVALTLVAWSAIIGLLLWQDPHAANDCALLLGRSIYADGNVYVPNLFLRTWDEGAPGLMARVAVWVLLGTALGVWMRRSAAGRSGGSPARALAGLAGVVLAAAFVLERWPPSRTGPRFGDALDAAPGVTVFSPGRAVRDGRLALERGERELLVRSRHERGALQVRAFGPGLVRVPGRPAVAVPPGGAALELPLAELRRLTGRRGQRETFYRARLTVEAGPVTLSPPAGKGP